MGQLTLSKLQKKQYKEIAHKFENCEHSIIEITDVDRIRLNDVLAILESLGYIREIAVDGSNMFELVGSLKDFDAWHKDRVREEQKLSSREWRIAIIAAVIGGVIGLIPYIISLFGGK